jgi:uncharacterized protein (TIGR03435 family)
MRRAILSAAVFILAAMAPLHAQSIAGTWEGALPMYGAAQGASVYGNPRIVFTIEKSADGSFHGGITFIDRGATVPLTSVTFSAPDVAFAESSAAFTYRGKLSADGQSITGTWTQSNQSFPLTLHFATADALSTREAPAPPAPMAADADPSYEVATIKPSTPDEQHPIFNLRAHRFNATGTSAKELIKVAWNIRGRQVIGGPPWLEDKKYDIVAEPDTPGLPSEEQSRAMVRKLLIERFHLVAHTGQQDYPVLALTLDPKAPRPVPSDPNFNPSGAMSFRRDGDDVVLQFSGTTIQQMLAFIMNTFQNRQLVDETGLSGAYNVTLRIALLAPSAANSGQVSSDDVGSALVEAAQHAGFKFISKKEPLPVVIIDHIELPTPN